MASITINLVDVVKNLSRQECQETIRLCETRLEMLQSMKLSVEEKMCVEDGRKIDAIRSFRNRTGVRLKDAKDVVEAYADTLDYFARGVRLKDAKAVVEKRQQEAEQKMSASRNRFLRSVAERRRQEAERKMEADNFMMMEMNGKAS